MSSTSSRSSAIAAAGSSARRPARPGAHGGGERLALLVRDLGPAVQGLVEELVDQAGPDAERPGGIHRGSELDDQLGAAAGRRREVPRRLRTEELVHESRASG